MSEHTAAYTAAVNRFLREAESLSDDDITILRSVDDQLAQRAVAKRAAMLHKAASIRHQLAMGQTPAKPTVADQMSDHVIDTIVWQLAEPRQRIKSLEGGHGALEQKVRDLETLVLELRAQLAEAPHARS
jgi:hypothetical protein